ncbi:MAG TPA: BadF/BadG/BcrA/BcrD ATPase family protein [Terriglobales bacterium]|nr:BadF/BadG/BcrA/BcrD ATPase family protein [Terriglobales bacterium]
MPFFLGIDGGGTKTRCLLGDNTSVLSTGNASGCNVLRVGEACARDSLSGAIHEACVQAGVSPSQITRTCAGIAGAADDGVASLVQRLLIGIVGGAIEVIGDMEIALESAFPDGVGVVVIAGTGSIAYARNRQGETARAGGWGRMVSDEGSGHWIGLQAIRMSLHEHDRGEESELLEKLMPALEARTVNDLAARVNANPPPDFASLFPMVLELAEGGEPLAARVLHRAGEELAQVAAAVIGRTFPLSEEAPVANHGGVFGSSARVKQVFKQRLTSLCPNATCVDVTVDPALGALGRARREFGIWHKKAFE